MPKTSPALAALLVARGDSQIVSYCVDRLATSKAKPSHPAKQRVGCQSGRIHVNTVVGAIRHFGFAERM